MADFEINEISSERGKILKTAILKSSYILLLCNTIESTTTVVFERIHEALSTENYDVLIPEVQAIWVDFFFNKHSQGKYKDHLDRTMNGDLKFPVFEVFLNRTNLFSGNLDGRKLDGLLKEYGIGGLNTKSRDKLLYIKNKRNKLAHGEELFRESCRNMTISELELLQNATFDALDSIVAQAKLYLVSNNSPDRKAREIARKAIQV